MATLFVDKIDPQSGTSLTIGSSGDTISKGSGVVSRLGVFESQLLHVRDEKSNQTHGGTNIAGVNTRDLNTIKTNEITGASLSSNQITLPTGTYYIDASAPTYVVGYNHVYLYNVTDSANEIYGYNDYANGTDGASRSHVIGRFTIASQKVFELRHYTQSSVATVGLGLHQKFNSLPSTYAEVLIWRTA